MRKSLITAVVTASLFTLTACGNEDDTDTAGGHNDADVTFAQEMIPHHQQAIEMSRMAAQNAGSQQVKDLAARIEAAKGPEIDKLNGWLRDWNAQQSGHGGHGGHGGHSMTGMMSTDEMASLGQTKGAEFDQKFLMLMIKHHEGAVAMARTEVDKGRFPDTQQMAREIMIGQQSEIDSMRTMLTQH